MPVAFHSLQSRLSWPSEHVKAVWKRRLRVRVAERAMEQRVEEVLSPYRTFSRAEWAEKRADTPMTLAPEEVTRLRSMHDRLDMREGEDIYLPLSRLLAIYVAAAQRLFRAQQGFLGTEDSKMPYIIGV